LSRVEVEVKLRVGCEEAKALLQRLSSIGLMRGPLRERDVYYSHPCRDFSTSDEAVRVRYVNDSPCCLTYKGSRLESQFKARTEINVNVSEDPAGLLEALGFTRYVEVVKTRYYIDLSDVQVTIDFVNDLGCFVEVESKDSDEASVTRALEEFGIRGEIIKETYAELMYRARRPGDLRST
jgi:adenylate cyclase class 2